jgi:GNAT superfamily N-acetyltransferase
MSEPATLALLEAIEEFYAMRNAPVRVDLCPLADSSLVELLASRGYGVERFYTVLATRLPSPLGQEETQAGADDIRITQATTAEAARWLMVVGQGFDHSEQPTPQTLAILEPNIYAANAHAFFAWLGDEPVGGGSMFDHGGVAEYGGASTRPAYRRQGVQSALLRHRLAAAHALGCDLGMVLTTPGTISQRNVQRFGFAVAYTKATMRRD